MPRQIETSTRELPIPIDDFPLEPVPVLPESESARLPRLDGFIDFWVSLGPGIQDGALTTLLSRQGVTAARINTTKFTDSAELRQYIRACELHRNASRHTYKLCLDTGGPKIRVRLDDQEYLDVRQGDILLLLQSEKRDHLPSDLPGDNTKILPIDSPLPLSVRSGYVLISDGWQQLRILERDREILWCEALHDAHIYNHRGITVEGLYDELPSVTDADVEALRANSELLPYVDFFGLSFVRSADDLLLFRKILKEFEWQGRVIAKIETRTGLEKCHEITEAADAVMIARGDLAVELALSNHNVIEAEDTIRDAARFHGKGCVIATRVADSLEEGRESLDEHELSRLYHEIREGLPMTLMLANETLRSETAVRNYDIVYRTAQLLLAASGIGNRTLNSR